MAVSVRRKIPEAPFYIGQNEKVKFTLDFAGFVPSTVTVLTDPVVTLYDITSGEPGTNVSVTKLSGSPTFASLVMTLPFILNPTKGSVYMLRCQGQGGGGIYELWGEVYGEL